MLSFFVPLLAYEGSTWGECDIWADREPRSCGEGPEKSPLKPFVHFPLDNEKRRGDLAVCAMTVHYSNSTGGEKESVRETLDIAAFKTRRYCFSIPEDRVISAACFQRDAVPDFVANVDIHLISYSQSEIYCLLCMYLGTNHHAMMELD